ncbi:hypothetical protein ILYODFUR_026459 [Ilyodon furcidens]|uniref:Uncharacterized protein n=1 Tax=Ilyodon furcidens TaxID=33524 RepID=A0ABV0T0E3_9TELE
MNQDSSLLLPHWIKPAGSLLIPSFCGSPSVNPVHPPSSIAPTTETLGPSIILAHQYSVSSPMGNQPPGLSTPLWRISPSNHWYLGSSFLHISTSCK